MLSKAFSKSMKSRRPGIFFVLAYLIMLSMSLIFSPIVLFFRKTVRSLLMIFGRTFLMRFAIDLAAILVVTVKKGNWSPVFQKIGRFIFLTNKSNQTSSLRD